MLFRVSMSSLEISKSTAALLLMCSGFAVFGSGSRRHEQLVVADTADLHVLLLQAAMSSGSASASTVGISELCVRARRAPLKPASAVTTSRHPAATATQTPAV